MDTWLLGEICSMIGVFRFLCGSLSIFLDFMREEKGNRSEIAEWLDLPRSTVICNYTDLYCVGVRSHECGENIHDFDTW